MKRFKISIFKFLIAVTPLYLLLSFAGLTQKMTEAEAVNTALQQNQLIKSAEYQVDYFRQMKKTGSDMGNLSVVFMNGQYNTIEKDNNITLTQSIPFPGRIGAQMKLGEERINGSSKNVLVIKNNLVYDVKSSFEMLKHKNAYHKLLLSQDSLFSDFARASTLRYKTGESNFLEMTTAKTQLLEVKNMVWQNEADIYILQKKLQALLKSDSPVDAASELSKRIFQDTSTSIKANPQLQYFQQQVIISGQEKRVERNRLMPDFTVGYFNQSLIGYQNTTGQDAYYGKSYRFQGFNAGITIPLWFAPQAARAKAASFQEESSRHSAEHFLTMLNSDYEQALRELDKHDASLIYYETSALKNANLILSQARKAYQGGEIGYLEYLLSLKNAIAIKANYLQALSQYNLAVVKVEFLTGQF